MTSTSRSGSRKTKSDEKIPRPAEIDKEVPDIERLTDAGDESTKRRRDKKVAKTQLKLVPSNFNSQEAIVPKRKLPLVHSNAAPTTSNINEPIQNGKGTNKSKYQYTSKPTVKVGNQKRFKRNEDIEPQIHTNLAKLKVLKVLLNK